MRFESFDVVYQVLNEKFINEIIDSESDKIMGQKNVAMNFLLLGESDKTETIKHSDENTVSKIVFEVEQEQEQSIEEGPEMPSE